LSSNPLFTCPDKSSNHAKRNEYRLTSRRNEK
jgi:hypothetical protein